MQSRRDIVLGGLIGCAVGDALGLHREGLSARRAAKMFPDPDRYYFLGRRGATSDDYDHACMTVEALCAAGGDPEGFARELASRIKVWAACIPGGIGLATLKSSIKLWVGVSPTKSGVFSAGNGPAMRSHILGCCISDLPQLIDFVRASTLISHTDPKAFTGALAIAMASRHSSTADRVAAEVFLDETRRAIGSASGDAAFVRTLEDAIASVGRGETTQDYAKCLGRSGVSGYIYHTVPVVIHAWLSYPDDFPTAIKAIISCGGDSDTTGSILGGIIGARLGRTGIPSEWIDGLILWPRSIQKAGALADALATGGQSRVPAWKYIMRNAWFDSVVLLHGLRRLAPPY